ncbi:MAG: hypothetical protein ABSF09_08265 [Candidatus Bathyarchaeia archaeon]|jgi:hypothetical protein
MDAMTNGVLARGIVVLIIGLIVGGAGIWLSSLGGEVAGLELIVIGVIAARIGAGDPT